METALADRECYGLESSDARMSCFFNKVGIFPYVNAFMQSPVSSILLLTIVN